MNNVRNGLTPIIELDLPDTLHTWCQRYAIVSLEQLVEQMRLALSQEHSSLPLNKAKIEVWLDQLECLLPKHTQPVISTDAHPVNGVLGPFHDKQLPTVKEDHYE